MLYASRDREIYRYIRAFIVVFRPFTAYVTTARIHSASIHASLLPRPAALLMPCSIEIVSKNKICCGRRNYPSWPRKSPIEYVLSMRPWDHATLIHFGLHEEASETVKNIAGCQRDVLMCLNTTRSLNLQSNLPTGFLRLQSPGSFSVISSTHVGFFITDRLHGMCKQAFR